MAGEQEKSKGVKKTSPRNRKTKITKSPAADEFPVIGVGASAGGLEAFGKLLGNIPEHTGMAFVLIQHLDPTHTSNMVELLRRYTRIPVEEAADGTKLEPDHIYMIPPNRSMTVADHALILTEQAEHAGIVHSIDHFFRSLATDLKEKAICIILSGTGSDGAIGAKEVKAELGMVIVQDPETAGYDGMPRAAITAGVADYVLPVEDMPRRLMAYVKGSYGNRAARRRDAEKDTASLTSILTLVKVRTKRDFSSYKQSTINRRIERRMSINQLASTAQYLKFLHEHPKEIEALVKDFLINVTSFFRDQEAFKGLKKYLKKLIEAKPEGSEIRVWVPGCSTGEEAYSIVIIIEEVLEELKKYCILQVFGTDLDREAINTARAGIYPAAIAADVSETRLKKFFSKKDDQYQVKRELREKLIFAEQDITADPPFTRLDIISARNLLIYFDTSLQKRLMPMMHYALNPDGLLFLGTAENIGEFTRLFTPLDRKLKIFQAIAKEKRPPYGFTSRPVWKTAAEAKNREETGAHTPFRPGIPVRTPEQLMLEALPASVLVDADFQVIFTHGNTRKYLGVPEGAPNTGVMEIVHTEIRPFLSSALQEAVSKKKTVIRDGGRVKLNSHTQPIRITVMPVESARPGEPNGRLIVTFQDLPEMKLSRKSKLTAGDTRIRELEQELQLIKENLRSTIEQLESANEELRSANEEYLSTNEELQSTNEELETSHEELQSVNEELSTVNTEHQAKIEELSTVNDDMKNLLNSTPIATIYLDNDFKVQRFTPAASNIFNLIEADIARPIVHITSNLGDYDIMGKARNVLDTLIPVQDVIQTNDGRWYTLRIIPYRTADNAIAGIVLTFVDISDQERMKVALSYAEAIIDTLFQPVLVLDKDLKVISANHAFYDLFQVDRRETENKLLYDIDNRHWNIPELRKLLEEILPKEAEFRNFTVEGDFGRAGRRKLLLNARRLQEKNGETQRILLAMEDITGKG